MSHRVVKNHVEVIATFGAERLHRSPLDLAPEGRDDRAKAGLCEPVWVGVEILAGAWVGGRGGRRRRFRPRPWEWEWENGSGNGDPGAVE